ncbi:Xylanolytic transcriptional activator xlnR [Hypsizygus marmoreus]|uniref:Xylanolytic transcriptional activator xlnR n=1 Tax=Hypsizygus marmoreus TaxID=39966 RepID=A0A369JLU0_HYPMA|nr:Xylanolytic transcriptional activator xlnR [Hypsizygus marmoreus]
MSDFADIKSEDVGPDISPSPPALGGQSAYPIGAEARFAPVPFPDAEQHYHGRAHGATPPDRQRTVQACDKCRERKTKCSGDHPVCHRCATRGLICQYSSREPRTRGPSKARLRNAVSTTDLHALSSHVRSSSQTMQGLDTESQTRLLQQYGSREIFNTVQADYSTARRVASLPRSYADVHPESQAVPSTYETWRETYAPHVFQGYDDGSYVTPQYQAPPTHFPTSQGQPQWRDVRRVQSHSTLIGNSGSGLGRNTQNGMHFPDVNNLVGPASSYGHYTPQGNISQPFQDLSVTSFGHQSQIPYEQEMPWAYHSDGGSTGSNPRSAGEPNPDYSPTSSEDIPKSSRPGSSLGSGSTSSDARTYIHAPIPSNYSNYRDQDLGGNVFPRTLPQGSCPPLSFTTSNIVPPSDHYAHGTAAPRMARPNSDSSIHPDLHLSFP